MKVLFIYTDSFSYTIGEGQDTETNLEMSDAWEDIQTAFIQVEEKDQENENTGKLVTKLVKQLKWVARKNNSNRVLLHSFAHLSNSKADPAFAKKLFDHTQERLENAGFEVYQTPYGYFLDLELKAPGKSLARVFWEE